MVAFNLSRIFCDQLLHIVNFGLVILHHRTGIIQILADITQAAQSNPT